MGFPHDIAVYWSRIFEMKFSSKIYGSFKILKFTTYLFISWPLLFRYLYKEKI